ncbi:uncharacterized protein LOC120836525 [Ixodes scapularis]|uniref:uncharacterized protein LOC120836525 n=1 Tax=Ixodes scapularis TaxID=6945 RepID=UPI001A9D51B0|nr:uncharacterized protein LOC120836525 [Ixodes scapularis]
MQLVVLAVVLILPSFLSGESFSHTTDVLNECEAYIRGGGDRECTLLRSEYKKFDPEACGVMCNNGKWRLFPDGVCSNGTFYFFKGSMADQYQDFFGIVTCLALTETARQIVGYNCHVLLKSQVRSCQVVC